jgi:hypothetical protein
LCNGFVSLYALEMILTDPSLYRSNGRARPNPLDDPTESPCQQLI